MIDPDYMAKLRALRPWPWRLYKTSQGAMVLDDLGHLVIIGAEEEMQQVIRECDRLTPFAFKVLRWVIRLCCGRFW